MINRILIGLAIVSLITSVSLYSASSRMIEPVEDVPIEGPPPADLGIVQQGKKVPFQFHLKNNGTRPIVVTEVVASCGCTAVDEVKGPLRRARRGPGDRRQD